MGLLAKVKFKEGGIRKIACVLKPAVQEDVFLFSLQENFLSFADETIQFAFDNEKHNITGVVLIPDRKYYRNNDFFKKVFNKDDDGHIEFEKDVVADYSKDYLKNGMNAFNTNHSVDVNKNDIELFESWIINTPNDKAYDLGYKKDRVTQGTWMMTQHINTQTDTGLQLWQDFKLGKYKGFSIQGSPAIELVQDTIINSEEDDEKLADDIALAIAEILK
jgi:hypothetical protein